MTTLKTALLEAYYMELEDMPSEETLSMDEELTFSVAFERRMKRLIRRTSHPIGYRVIQTVACILLVAMLSGCTVLAVSPEAREAFVGWVREVYETMFVYHYVGPVQEIPEGVFYAPSWMPEGYREIKRSDSGPTRNIFYQNSEGDIAAFYYTADPETLRLYIEAEYAAGQSTCVKEYAATLYMDQREQQANVLVWTDTETNILFFISAHATSEELINMAESVEIVPTEYHPTYITEGYLLYDKFVTDRNTILIYKNEMGKFLSLSYGLAPEDNWAYQYTDGSYIKKRVFVNETPADLYLPAEEGLFSKLLWSDLEEEGAFFTITACLPEEEILRFAESIKAIPEVPVPHHPTWTPEGYYVSGENSSRRSIELYYENEDTRRFSKFRK